MRSAVNKILKPILEWLGISAMVFRFLEKNKVYLRLKFGKKNLEQITPSIILDKEKITAIAIIRKDQHELIPYFIAYYSNLSIKQFVLISEQGKTIKTPKNQINISQFSFINGEHLDDTTLLNELLPRINLKGWALCLRINELLHYPHQKTRNIKELCAHLDNLEQRTLYCLKLDLYNYRPIKFQNNKIKVFKQAFFELNEYISNYEIYSNSVSVRKASETLSGKLDSKKQNRIPLLKMFDYIQFSKNRYSINDNRWNSPLKNDVRHTSGIILSLCKGNPNEGNLINFQDGEQLEDLQLMQRGEWF